MRDRSVIWRRLDRSGREFCRLFFRHSIWHLAGTTIFTENDRPCRLDYRVMCDSNWQTQCGRIEGWTGEEPIEIEITADGAGRWRFNGIEHPGVSGCTDLDLNFSPATNLIPIRRLNLAIGEAASVRSAWLRFPNFSFEPLDQIYQRTSAQTYRYELASEEYSAELRVNSSGFVTWYPELWVLESAA